MGKLGTKVNGRLNYGKKIKGNFVIDNFISLSITFLFAILLCSSSAHKKDFGSLAGFPGKAELKKILSIQWLQHTQRLKAVRIASMSIQRPSSNISTSSSRWSYDVFLSFRGEDTRKGFLGHLYHALELRGINVFMDDKELEMGKSISLELFKAIEESRISIIVFSRNYASSTWCLDELVKIAECMKIMRQIVLPIFYDVDPSMVRKQTGTFHEAFLKHEKTFGKNIEKVQNWRTTLIEVANLRGWDLKDRHESEFIQEIVKEISNKLTPTTSRISNDLVGIDSRLVQLRRLMGTKSDDDVRMIGIHGMGGIGKTTIARAVYDLISCEFDSCSFLENVRENSEKNGMFALQRQLLSQIVRERDFKIWDVYDGVQMIRDRLWRKKVLIVVDDVDDVKQLETLIGNHDWFGLGSRVIITTRNKHLLKLHGVDKIYEVEKLCDDEALQLLSLKAFKNYQPLSQYMELSKRVVKYVGGLPLALKVLGSLLFSRTIDEWESALQRLGREPEKGIFDSLQISFDGLKELEKEIFLDIACFFKGKNKDYVANIMEGCGFNPTFAIRVLIDKSLITITDDNLLWMHDLIQELGQQIVKRESLKEPGKRSRLWKEDDVHHVLTKNTGTETVEGIMLEKEVQLNVRAKVFEKMTNLRLLRIHNVQLSEGLEYLSNELRLLDWHGYPLKSLPSSLQLDKTIELKLHESRIEQLWKETKSLQKLKVISLSHSVNFKSTPDFTEVPNLEELILEGCTRLHEIHSSLLVHKNLILLNLKDCISLTTLPSKINMKSLTRLVLSGCVKLKKFPKMVQSMECLSELLLDKTSIKELPFPIEFMKGLVLLSLKDCKNLVILPNNINCLKSLKTLDISGCSKIENVPENLGQVESLEELSLGGTAIRQPVSSIFRMENLKLLSFHGCKATPSTPWSLGFPFYFRSRISDPVPLMLPSLSGMHSLTNLDLDHCNLSETSILKDICSLVSLKTLRLRRNKFVSLPACINQLKNLEYLDISGCKKLQSLPQLPCNLTGITLRDSPALETLWKGFKSCHPVDNSFSNSFKLLGYSRGGTVLKRSKYLLMKTISPGSKIPVCFNHQSEGSLVRIKGRQDLKLKGYAMCGVFSFKKHISGHHYKYRVKSTLTHYSFTDKFRPAIGAMHDPLVLYSTYIYSCDQSPGSYDFEFESLDPFLEVKRCAAHLIYEHVDELDNEMDPGSSSAFWNLIEFLQDFLAPLMSVAGTKRSLPEYDGPVAQSKRPKYNNSL